MKPKKAITYGTRFFSKTEESGTAWALYPATMTDNEIVNDSGMESYYGGVGRPFCSTPWIRRTTKHVLIQQNFGWDI